MARSALGSNLWFEISLYMSQWYALIFFVLTLAGMVYKSETVVCAYHVDSICRPRCLFRPAGTEGQWPLYTAGLVLPDPRGSLGWEAFLVFATGITELARCRISSYGNKTESANAVFVGVLFALPLIIAYSYFLQLQTYVLRLDQIISGISLVFVVLGIILGVVSALGWSRRQGQF